MGKKSTSKRTNQPCPCGSGKKIKDCCGLKKQQKKIAFSELPIDTQKMLRELQKKYIKRQEKYGSVSAPVSAVFKGVRYVAVGDKLVPFDKNKTYLDFLNDYLKTITGAKWGNAELKKPINEQHQIIKLYKKVVEAEKKPTKHENGLYSIEKTGTLQAWYQLGYDLHVLSHCFGLHSSVLERLKRKDQYQGARYELSVTAAMIRAGFEITHQDEYDPSSQHFEFTASHRKTGQIVAVEAKSKHRSGILDFSGEKTNSQQSKIKVGRLIGDALKKPSKYPMIVFVDQNLPFIDQELQNSIWVREIKKTIANKEKEYKDGIPANLFVFTNQPHHYEDQTTPNPLSSYMMKKTNNPKIQIEHTEILDAIALSLSQYGNIPNFFEDHEI